MRQRCHSRRQGIRVSSAGGLGCRRPMITPELRGARFRRGESRRRRVTAPTRVMTRTAPARPAAAGRPSPRPPRPAARPTGSTSRAPQGGSRIACGATASPEQTHIMPVHHLYSRSITRHGGLDQTKAVLHPSSKTPTPPPRNPLPPPHLAITPSLSPSLSTSRRCHSFLPSTRVILLPSHFPTSSASFVISQEIEPCVSVYPLISLFFFLSFFLTL